MTGNTFEVSGRRPGGQCGKGCREPAQPAPGRDRGCQGTRLPRLRVDSRRSRAPSTGVSYGGAGTAAPLRRPRAGDGAGAWAGARPAGGGGRAAGEGPGRPSERCLGAPSHTTCPGDRQHGPRRGRGAERTPCRWGVSQVPGRLWPAADSGRLRPFILLLSRRGPRALPLAEGPVWAQQAVGRGRHPPPPPHGWHRAPPWAPELRRRGTQPLGPPRGGLHSALPAGRGLAAPTFLGWGSVFSELFCVPRADGGFSHRRGGPAACPDAGAGASPAGAPGPLLCPGPASFRHPSPGAGRPLGGPGAALWGCHSRVAPIMPMPRD